MAAKDELGRYGEDVAVRHLEAGGMAVVERNWRCARGEIDVVARDGDTVVFVEVKTRRTDRWGSPAEAVGYAKGRRLRLLAAQWLADRRPGVTSVRFDVVSVLRPPAGAAVVEHLRGVL